MNEQIGMPEPLPVHFEHIPKRLQEISQWVFWKYATIDGEVKKPPFSPKTGKPASVRQPSTWGSFLDARKAYETGRFAGVGIVLTQETGLVGIDIDHCYTDGKLTDEAQQIIRAVNSYTERSPSGSGIRIMAEGKLPGAYRRRGSVEMYEDMRYLTLTGHALPTTPQDVQPRYRELYGLYHRIFPKETPIPRKENTGGGESRGVAKPSQRLLPDEVVLQKALSAHNGVTFARYYKGDPSLWEGAGAERDSQSAADFTLVLLLLYWTNSDIVQVDRLFRHSGLMRPKWDRPIKGSETYGQRVIHDALRKGKR